MADILRVLVFSDDINVTGRNDQEHFEILETVLQKLKRHGIRVNVKNCEFFKKSVQYCCGIRPKKLKRF